MKRAPANGHAALRWNGAVDHPKCQGWTPKIMVKHAAIIGSQRISTAC
jgi:hypothetical protein